MTTAMLWFDNSAEPLKDKIERAAAYYERKYGKTPNFCEVNPAMMTGEMPDGISVIAADERMSNHFWIGAE